MGHGDKMLVHLIVLYGEEPFDVDDVMMVRD